eukprot:3227775-Rhodomonas_salina.2
MAYTPYAMRGTELACGGAVRSSRCSCFSSLSTSLSTQSRYLHIPSLVSAYALATPSLVPASQMLCYLYGTDDAYGTAYAPATPCPVLTSRMLLPGATAAYGQVFPGTNSALWAYGRATR